MLSHLDGWLTGVGQTNLLLWVWKAIPNPTLIIPLGPSSALEWPIKALKRHIFLYSSYTNVHKP